MRCIKLGSLVGCTRVPQVPFVLKGFVRKQTMCKSVYTYLTVCFAFKSRAGFFTTLLTAAKLYLATLNPTANYITERPKLQERSF